MNTKLSSITNENQKQLKIRIKETFFFNQAHFKHKKYYDIFLENSYKFKRKL